MIEDLERWEQGSEALRAGPQGCVHGVDLNREFLRRARVRAQSEGVAKQVQLHHAPDDRIPLPDGCADRLVCKNVLEYVPDVDATLSEFHRVVRPGGLAHATDSDWGMLVVEPLGPEAIAELFEAAKPAYRTPLIGRKLYGAFRAAGFSEVRITTTAPCDTRGLMAPILRNMAEYARASGRMPQSRIDALLADVQRAIEAETYLLVLPQFLVTGRV